MEKSLCNLELIVAKDIKVGMYIIHESKPCKSLNVTTSKTGKHGHIKVNINCRDLITQKQVNIVLEGHKSLYKFTPYIRIFTLCYVEDNNIECIDDNGNNSLSI